MKHKPGILFYLALMLGLGLILRVVLAPQVIYPQVDGAFYLDQARELVARHYLPHSSFPPGFPFLISIVLSVLHIDDPMAPLRAAQTVNVLAGTLLGLLTFFALRRKLPEIMALVGAGIIIFLPHCVFFSKSDMSEMSYGCFLLGAWLTWQRRDIVTGLLLGYAYLIRPEVLLVPVALGIITLVSHRKFPWRLALGVLIPVIPYVLYLHDQTGIWTLTSKSVFISKSLVANQGTDLFALVMSNLSVLIPGLAGLLGIPFCLAAIFGAIALKRAWLCFLLPLLTLPFFSFAMTQRFWVPYLPFLILAAGVGLSWIRQRWAFAGTRKAMVSGILVVFIGLGIVVIDDAHLYTKVDEIHPLLQQAGLWLRERVGRDTIIACYKPQPSYWAWARFAKCPAGNTAAEIIDDVKSAGASFLVVDVYTSMVWRPELLPLLKDPEEPLPDELDSRVQLVMLLTNDVDYRMNTYVYLLK